jgi:hypothetical protein
VASTAGSLATTGGAAAAFSRGFVGAAVLAGLVALVAFRRMPAERVADGGGHLHLH